MSFKDLICDAMIVPDRLEPRGDNGADWPAAATERDDDR
jgi:hypothetical protein